MAMNNQTILSDEQLSTLLEELPEYFKTVQLAEVDTTKLGKILTCREDNNKVRRVHIPRTAEARIPLTRDGERWLGYVFDDISSGAYPAENGLQYLHQVLKSGHTLLTIVCDPKTAGRPLWSMPSGDTGGVSCGLPVFQTAATFDADDAAAFVLRMSGWAERNSYGSECVLPSDEPWQGEPLRKLAESAQPGCKFARQFLEILNTSRARIMLSFSKTESYELWKAAFAENPTKTANSVTDFAICFHGDHALRVPEGKTHLDRYVLSAILPTGIRLPATSILGYKSARGPLYAIGVDLTEEQVLAAAQKRSETCAARPVDWRTAEESAEVGAAISAGHAARSEEEKLATAQLKRENLAATTSKYCLAVFIESRCVFF